MTTSKRESGAPPAPEHKDSVQKENANRVKTAREQREELERAAEMQQEVARLTARSEQLTNVIDSLRDSLSSMVPYDEYAGAYEKKVNSLKKKLEELEQTIAEIEARKLPWTKRLLASNRNEFESQRDNDLKGPIKQRQKLEKQLAEATKEPMISEAAYTAELKRKQLRLPNLEKELLEVQEVLRRATEDAREKRVLVGEIARLKEQEEEETVDEVLDRMEKLSEKDDEYAEGVSYIEDRLQEVLADMFKDEGISSDSVHIASREEEVKNFFGDRQRKGGIFLEDVRIANFTVVENSGNDVEWDNKGLQKAIRKLRENRGESNG